MSAKNSFVFIVLLILIIEVIPIEIELQEGEEIKRNNIDDSQLNECLSVRRSNEVGVCFGKELLNKLNKYDEADSFSLATGVSFVRDEKTPRDIGSFLDKDPMDFRSLIEDASNLISKRSLHWDLSVLYPGLVMRIAPTLANGVLEFVMDPKIKDRTYQQHPTEVSTGRLLARNLLVPFLLGFKFQLSTLLPIVLGLLLIASKKAFLLAKLALLAVTVFSTGFGGQSSFFGGAPHSSSYTSYEPASHFHDHHDHHSSGYYRRHQPPPPDYYYREKSADPTTATPITPGELRDRLERLFVTKKEVINDPRDDVSGRNSRNFQWTPISTG